MPSNSPSQTRASNDVAPRRLVIELLEPALARAGVDAQNVDDSFNVIDSGVVDSLEFLDLLARLERHTGAHFELYDADPDVLTTIGGLVALVEQPDRPPG